MPNSPPAPPAREEIARALGRASSDYLLRSLELIRKATNGNLLDSVICLAIARGNLHHFLGDEVFEREFGSIGAVPPDAVRRPVSVRGLADFLDLPYETVRRNVLKLVAEGFLERRDGGFAVPAKVIERETWREAVRANLSNLERLVRTYRRLTGDRALETIP